MVIHDSNCSGNPNTTVALKQPLKAERIPRYFYALAICRAALQAQHV